ncbi:uncharacterized protein TNCV_3460201 [Trichonephila clavipes]|nr:uncharacterized protein TNCV_3460201 [Trichonephila clavipes]
MCTKNGSEAIVKIYRFWNSGAGGARRLRRMQTKEGGSPPGSEPGRCRNETTHFVSRNETTQLCTAVDRLQPPSTAYNRLQPSTTAYSRLQPPTPPTTACNRLQPPATAYNRLHRLHRLHRLYSRIGFFYLLTTPHLRLPENIRELIRAKNKFRKLWNETRYPPYKREVNALIRQIRREIQEHKNRTWKDFLLTLNPEDNSLYNLHRKFSKRHIPLPPLHGPGGMAYSDFEKAEVFKDTLEVTFQENEEPYCDDKIEEVESLVDD